MPKILDLDLDLFQNKVVRDFCGTQDDKTGLKPWGEKKVKKYLEENIGLSSPVKGRVFKTHDMAFYFWKELINDHSLSFPFSVDHLDAHSDMGFGNSVWLPMINKYMHYPPHKRNDIPLTEMNAGNYLLFAFAMGWINELNYVHHKDFKKDILICWYKDFDQNTNKIQMVACNNLTTDDHFDLKSKVNKIVHRDAPIDLVLTEPHLYKNNMPIEFMNVAISPRYTCSDTKKYILPIIEEYIEKI